MPAGSSSEAPVMSPGPSRSHSPATRASYRRARDVHQVGTSTGGRAMWNKDEVDGKVDQVKGKVKQATGDLTDNEKLREEGQADETVGEVQEGLGKGRRKVGEALKDLGDKIGH